MKLLLFLYSTFLLVAGAIAQKKSTTFRKYAIGSQSLSWWLVTATLSASFLGGAFSLGVSSKVYSLGLIYVIAMWGFSLKELLVAKYIIPNMKNFRSMLTVGDLFGKQYGDNTQRLIGVLSVILCAGIVGVQINAIGYLLHIFIDIPETWGIAIGTLIIIFYTVLGGFTAIVITDVVQAVVLLLGIPVALLFAFSAVGGIGAGVEQIVANQLLWKPNSVSGIGLIGLVLTFLFGETLIPPYFQRMLIGANESETQRGTYTSGWISIIFFAIVGTLGAIAVIVSPGITPELALPTLIKTTMPVVLQGVLLVGLLSAVMSSADSFLHAGAIACCHDIFRSESNRLAHWITIIMGILSIFAAIWVKSLIDLCIYSWTFWAPIVLVPLVHIIIGKPLSKKQFAIGSLCSIITIGVWQFVFKSPHGIEPLVIAVIVNYLVTRKS